MNEIPAHDDHLVVLLVAGLLLAIGFIGGFATAAIVHGWS